MKGWAVVAAAACASFALVVCVIGGLTLMATVAADSEPETYSTTYDETYDDTAETEGERILREVWEETPADDREGVCEDYIYDPVGSINAILDGNEDVLTYSEVEIFLDDKCF